MRFGPLTLSSNLFLSPLAGYTNLPFRLVVREIGGVGLCTTDLVNARSLLEKRTKAFKLIETNAADHPLAVQLFGSVPEEMRDAAQVLETRGINSIDINMGCPVRKVVKVGGGSAMMTELGKTSALVKGMVDAVKIPVTAKMRLGWDDQNITAPDLARALEDVGVAAIFVHGRTREQGFGGTVNLAGIRAVVEAVKCIPVIGNGDVTTPQAAKHMLEETGCAGVSIGRGAFYDPWIFKRTKHYLETCRGGGVAQVSQHAVSPMSQSARGRNVVASAGLETRDTADLEVCATVEGGNAQNQAGATLSPSDWERDGVRGELLPEPSFTERVQVLRRHFDLMVEVFGEDLGCRMFRKIAPWYSKRFGPASVFNKGVVLISNRSDFEAVLAKYLDWRRQFVDERGELLPRFQQAPMVASFMQAPGTETRQAIPVPKGPVEVW